jgi:hypothetical protein
MITINIQANLYSYEDIWQIWEHSITTDKDLDIILDAFTQTGLTSFYETETPTEDYWYQEEETFTICLHTNIEEYPNEAAATEDAIEKTKQFIYDFKTELNTYL